MRKVVGSNLGGGFFLKQMVVAFYRLFHLRDVSPIKFEAFFELLEMELKSKKTLIKNVINDTALLDHNQWPVL
jgi:hypothetical protein